MAADDELHLGVALDGAGWHPAAWREPDATPDLLLNPDYWSGLVRIAETGLLDFVSIEDSMATLPVRRGGPDSSTSRVRGRLDAVLVAARVAPLTTSIGLIPSVTTTHTEPFHLSKAVATLDFVSDGRAGMQVRVSPTSTEASLFGRRTLSDLAQGVATDPEPSDQVVQLFDEAAGAVEVIRRLWDSWEDDAEIRDVASGRFIDRDRLHHIGFEGPYFSVNGPSITPRPPQGQPVVAALAHVPVAFDLAARSADVVFVTPTDREDALRQVATVRSHEEQVQRDGAPLRIIADLVVFLDDDHDTAEARKTRLDEWFGHRFRSDAFVFVGRPTSLADLLIDWRGAGIDGFRLRPGSIPHDLRAIAGGLAEEFRRRSVFRTRYAEHGLRQRFGLARPVNRYVVA
jgi:alkanesulfonate monooxygenase SsuD/methylene tetrahydromethanopterin reductase-like flavin-dependent oxidoreductase (luciferase family)